MTTSSTPGGHRVPDISGTTTSGSDGTRASALTGPTVTVATYTDYASAQRAVDYLSDNNFPVDRVAIVGTDLRLVEKVIGRLTIGRAALAGAGTGAWFGLLIGLLLGLFTPGPVWWRIMVFAILIGAAWGAIFGAIAHAFTRGRRDFASASMLQAAQYAVTVDPDHAEQARQLLSRLATQQVR
jgi:hypothetical protein